MAFDWNDSESEVNLQDRGFDFELAAHLFDSETEE